MRWSRYYMSLQSIVADPRALNVLGLQEKYWKRLEKFELTPLKINKSYQNFKAFMKHFLSIVLLLVFAPLSQNWASELTQDSGLNQSTSADSVSQINNTLQLQNNLNNKTHPLQVNEAFP